MAVELNNEPGHQKHDGATPLGRRRFLGLLGGAMFGVATRMVAPKITSAAPTPPLCNGAPGCDTCNDSGTCVGCDNGPAYTCGGNQCWLVSTTPDANGCRKYYNCCDWLRSDESVCICRSYAYTSCTGSTSPPTYDGIRVPGGSPSPTPSPTPSPSPSPSPSPTPAPTGRSVRGGGGSPAPSPSPSPEPPPTDGGGSPTRSIRR
ncbi:MAG: hypothetical protein ACR2LS_07820 [Thermomicrobiales bacterium]